MRLGELSPTVSTATTRNGDIRTDSATGRTEEDHPTYGAGLTASKPAQSTTKRSSKGSRRSRRTSSTTAIKLQLRTEEVALAVNERFDKELSERSLRAINRDAARAAEDAAMAAEDAKRADEDVKRAAEDAKRAEEDRQRQQDRVDRDIRRRREELEEEKIERAESIKRQKEIIRAKSEVVDSYEGSSIRTGSSVVEEVEITPEEKAAVFVNSSPFGAQSSKPRLETFTDNLLNAPISETINPIYVPAKYDPVPTRKPLLNPIRDNLLNAPFLHRQSEDIVNVRGGGFPTPSGIKQIPTAPANPSSKFLNYSSKFTLKTSELPTPIASSVFVDQSPSYRSPLASPLHIDRFICLIRTMRLHSAERSSRRHVCHQTT